MHTVELIRRATVQGDQEAKAYMQHCFEKVVLDWLRRHPKSAHACRLESEEHYVAQAFECFWQSTTLNQHVECNTLAAALQYLRASLNGAMLDKLRKDAQPRESSRPVPAELGEPHMEDEPSNSETWQMLKALLANLREVRLAYLLFHCGMNPSEIVRICPQEFDDVREVSGLRRTIMERVLYHANQIALATHTYE